MFLPWLTIGDPVEIAGVRFVPWHDAVLKITPELRDAEASLDTILEGYVDLEGNPIVNCVIATVAGRGAHLEEADYPVVRWATTMLFLATWSTNTYFAHFAQRYVGSATFQLVAQSFTITPVWMGIMSRRRDGVTMNGGYTHGDLAFTVPVQCALGETASVDTEFLAGLNAAHNAGTCATITDLQRSMPFVELANTDASAMTLEAEAILMASAFEQLLHGKASAYRLTRKFGVLFHTCGSATVATALTTRPGIDIDKSLPERATSQPTWWLHRKWIEELYDLRSKSVHGGTLHARTWAWTPFEHLVMAAVVFPLTVKLLLQRDGFYTLAETDRAMCSALDHLLAAPDWREDDEGDGPAWHRIVAERRLHEGFNTALRAAGYPTV